MDRDSLQERKNSLEEEFFRKQNADVIERLKSTRERSAGHAEMNAASGITDPAVLDRMIAHGLTPASLTAVALAPLVAVAWADRKLEDKERAEVLKEAERAHLTPGTPAYEMLEGWLREAPPASLLHAWAEYAQGLASDMEADGLRQFRETILERARAVATAAGGGFAGIGSKVSDAEAAVLKTVEDALAG